MITIQKAVETLLLQDIEARTALQRGIMNYSQYAKQIASKVESICLKKVKPESIVITLTRLKKTLKKSIPSDVPELVYIKGITTHSPLIEIVYEKSTKNIQFLSELFKKISQDKASFLTVSLAVSDIALTCSSELVETIESGFSDRPIMKRENLAAISLQIDTHYYDLPGVTYSLSKKIAASNIVLAETITSYREITFTFSKDRLADMVRLFER